MNACFSPLDHESLLQISGPDTLTFLQGQSTCDTQALSGERSLPGLFCNPQGRALADFLLVQVDEETVLLRLRRGIARETAETLGKYIAFSKATLTDAGNDWCVCGLWGDGAADSARQHFGAEPGERYRVTAGDGFRLVQLDDAGAAFECLLATDSGLRDTLATELTPGSQGDWDRLQIEAGCARLDTATAGEYVPQNLNYDLTGHISFTKGCYTGQEVVARLHYRGKSKKRLLIGTAAAAAWTPGDALYAAQGSKAEGVVINCATGSDGQSRLLVCTSLDHLDGGLVSAGDGGSVAVTLALPPYPIED